jgi:probable F420-dependent oxidoreductase
MKVDSSIGYDLSKTEERAASLEAAGFDGGQLGEVAHDPFLPIVAASRSTERLELATAITVAFARNPMTTAVASHDLNVYSKGRFILGLGSQIKPHITKRFSMPWSRPAERMNEYIAALRAIWACWNDGEPLKFRGEFYQHTLMTPMFDPGPSPFGPPRIFLAAVGPKMTQVAGATADGFFSHAFTTEPYFRDVTLPALDRGLDSADRQRSEIEISMPVFVVSGIDDADIASNERSVRQQIAFYGSTPAYRGVLDHHGWADASDELHAMSMEGKWEQMADVIDPSMLEAFAVVATPDRLAEAILERWGDVLDRVQFYGYGEAEAGMTGEILEILQNHSSS